MVWLAVGDLLNILVRAMVQTLVLVAEKYMVWSFYLSVASWTESQNKVFDF
jgi:hypothetical protein